MRYRDNLPLVSSNLLRMFYMLGLAIVLQLYLKDLGASPFQISLLEVIFWGGLFLFSPLWGALSDASGRKKVFLAASMLGGASLIPLFGKLDSVGMVLALRFVFAILVSAFPPAALAAMSEGRREERGKRLAPYNTSRAIGFLLGWGSSGLLVDFLGFTSAFQALALVGLVGFVAALMVRGVDDPEEVTLREVWGKAKRRWVPRRGDESLRNKGLNYLFASIFLRKAGLIGLASLIAVYAVDVLGMRASLLGLLLALNPLFQLLFIDIFGLVADRYGRRKVFLFGFLFTIPAPFLLSVGGNPFLFGLAYVFIGFSFAALVEGSTAFIGDVAPEGREGEFMGFRKSSQGLAGVVGPLLAGSVATFYGYTAMLYAMGVLVALGFVLAWFGTEESLENIEMRTSLRADLFETFSSLTRRK